jgi:PST family polysaccharide transporter
MKSSLKFRNLIGNFAANGMSEIAQRVSRLLVIVVVARLLEAEAIGIAAAAIAAGDILKALTENGVNQRIIAAKDEDIASITRTAHRVFWIWCLGLFVTQQVLAGAFYAYTGNALIAGLIALLAFEYLMMPSGLVQCALAMRNGKLNGVAAVAGGQIVLGNVLSALMVFIFPNPVSLILPRILSAPFWLIGMRRLHPWTKADCANAPVKPFVRYGGFVLAIEVMKTLRMQADKLLIGALMGAEVLGLYFFAFNAGLGIATSFSVAFARVIFPYFCEASDRNKAVADGVVLACCVVTPIVLLQALTAPMYVPIIFGEKWAEISDIVSILCLAAIPSLIWAAASQWMRAENCPEIELYVTIALTVSVLLSTAVLAPFGLVSIAWGYLAVSTIIQITASWPVLRITFNSLTQKA